MSDLMLLGILRQPRECWSSDPLFVMQQQNTCERAADKIEELQTLLSAETQRRQAAEAVVDMVISERTVFSDLRMWDTAKSYRKTYPKETAT